jgi:hypothetical protein
VNSSPTKTAFRVHPRDNVATLLTAAAQGDVIAVQGAGASDRLPCREAIEPGHKVALAPIAAGEPIIKYGITIGYATCPIALGQWVHLHNCRSGFDERSSTLDLRSGAPTDTPYA